MVGFNNIGWDVGMELGISGCDVGFEVGINVVGFKDVGWEVGMELGISDGYPKREVGYHNEKKWCTHFVPTSSCMPYLRRGFSRGRSTKGWRGQRSG